LYYVRARSRVVARFIYSDGDLPFAYLETLLRF
jgi:hypothetical protein